MALQRFAEKWDARNPNLRLIGAYIHCDETNGTVHLHIDYIPVAECTRGMKLQNSLDRALQQQGFKSENIHQTAQIAWQDREREALCAICRDFNIDAQHNQGISKGRKHLSTKEYIRAKEEQQAQIENELKPLKDELKKAKERKNILDKIDDIDIKPSKLHKGYMLVLEKDLKKLINTSKAYVVVKKEKEDIAKLKEKINEQSAELAVYKNKEKEERFFNRDKLNAESKCISKEEQLSRELQKAKNFISINGLESEYKKFKSHSAVRKAEERQ